MGKVAAGKANIGKEAKGKEVRGNSFLAFVGEDMSYPLLHAITAGKNSAIGDSFKNLTAINESSFFHSHMRPSPKNSSP